MPTISHSFTSKHRTDLLGLGAPSSAFCPKPFDLVKSLCQIDSVVPKVNARKLTVVKQFERYKKIFASPISSAYVMTISSFPSDTVGRYVAMTLFEKAYSEYMLYNTEVGRNRFKSVGPPIWHRIYNNYESSFIDNEQSTCFLVLSGVTSDATQLKRDKLRDILDKYDTVPRVVVTASDDPVSFASNTCFHSNSYLYLGPRDKDVLVI